MMGLYIRRLIEYIAEKLFIFTLLLIISILMSATMLVVTGSVMIGKTYFITITYLAICVTLIDL